MKAKTSEAEGKVLDYLVAHCECVDEDECLYMVKEDGFVPSTNWAQAGPIIERERICLIDQGGDYWQALWGWKEAFGPTPLVAAMRCYVASKLGDEVEIPEELK